MEEAVVVLLGQVGAGVTTWPRILILISIFTPLRHGFSMRRQHERRRARRHRADERC